MIKINNVTKKYDSIVLNNINLTLKKGNVYILKGISGSGKTTLLNILSGYDLNYDGDVEYNGKALKSMSKKELESYQSSIGYMLQKSALYEKLTLKENLMLISSDEGKINELAKTFNVEKILDKYPGKVSGGERQRIALIRCLLLENGIMILDEATSNLDYENSLNFVKYLKTIDKKNKIIIISTHKDIYNDYGNIFLNIDYGNITINGKENKSNPSINNNKPIKRNIFKSAIKTSKKESIVTLVFLSFMLLLTFITISFALNFKREYVKYIVKKKPYNVIDIRNDDLDMLENIIDYTYDNYIYDTDNYSIYSLFSESNDNLKNFIYKGNFPNNNEILINNIYLLNYYDNNIDKAINSKVTINNKDYIITGVVNTEYDSNYNNSYYTDLSDRNIIFMPYDELKTFGEIKDVDKTMVVIKSEYLIDIYTTDTLPERIKNTSMSYLDYSYNVKSIARDIKSITEVCFMIIIVLALLTLVFIGNGISLKLYYRQKELGYLEMFHFTKDDISSFITIEYFKEYIKPLITSIIIYLLLSIILLYIFNINIFIDLLIFILVLVIFILYIYLMINIPLNKYLKMDIKTLLNR